MSPATAFCFHLLGPANSTPYSSGGHHASHSRYTKRHLGRHRSRILKYYLEDGKTLKEVRELMLSNHGFSASRQQYLTQFSKWNLRKYLNSRTWNQINRSIRGRNLNLNDCEVHALGCRLPNKKLKKEISRHVPVTHQTILPATTPIAIAPLGIRGSTVIESVKKVKYSSLPFLDFLRRSAPLFLRYQDATDRLDALQLFHSNQSLSTLGDFQSDTPPLGLVGEFNLIEIVSPRSASPWHGESEIDLELVDQRQQSLRPQHSFIQSPNDQFSRLVASIGDFCSLLKASKTSDHLEYLSPADTSQGSWHKNSSHELVIKFARDYGADVQFNFLKFVVYSSHGSHNLGKEVFNSIFRWIRHNHLYGMIQKLLRLDTPQLQNFALKAFESQAFLDDPTLVTIVLNAISKLLNRREILNLLLTKVASSTNVIAVQYLLKAGADPNAEGHYWTPERFNWKALDTALLNSCDSKIVRALISAGAKPTPYALQIAARQGHSECAEMLLQAGCNDPVHLTPCTTISKMSPFLRNMTERLKWCSTPLQVASVAGHKAMVQLLLLYTKDLAKVNRQAQVVDPAHFVSSALHFFTSGLFLDPLKLAIMEGHGEIARVLLGNGADPNAPRLTQKCFSLSSLDRKLQVLRKHNLISTSKMTDLLEIIDSTRVSHATALQMAIYYNTLDPEVLLGYGADVNHLSPLGTALQFAAEKGNLNLVQSLVYHGAQVNEACPSAGKTALQHGAGTNNLELVSWLIGQGAEVNAAPAFFNGRSALQFACEKGNVSMVDLLLQHEARVNCAASPWFGVTALQAAASSGNLEIIDLLLTHGADVRAPGATMAGGRTALEAAVAGGHLHAVCRLIVAGADVNDTVSIQVPPQGKPTDEISHELRPGIDFQAVNPSRAQQEFQLEAAVTSVQLAVQSGSLEILYALLESGADLNGPVAQGYKVTLRLDDLKIFESLSVKPGYSSVQKALISQDMELLDEILDIGGEELSTHLGFACSIAKFENLPYILERADLNLVSTERLSFTLNGLLRKYIHHTYTNLDAEYMMDACKILLDAGAKPEATALHWIANFPSLSFYRQLIRHGANPNEIANDSTPLTDAVYDGDTEVVRLLLEAGADPNLHVNEAPLHYAESLDVTKLLLSWGADPNIVSPINDSGEEDFYYWETPLQSAALRGRLQIVTALIEAGANPAARNSIRPEHTALHFAARHGHLDTAALLIENDPEVDSLAERCETAADEADLNGHFILGDWLRNEAGKRVDIVTELS